MTEENNSVGQTDEVETLLNVSKTSKNVNVSVATVVLKWISNIFSSKKGE